MCRLHLDMTSTSTQRWSGLNYRTAVGETLMTVGQSTHTSGRSDGASERPDGAGRGSAASTSSRQKSREQSTEVKGVFKS